MPKVKGRKYPYTKKGMAQAAADKKTLEKKQASKRRRGSKKK